MGCRSSTPISADQDTLADYERLREALGWTERDFAALHEAFTEACVLERGTMSFSEFLMCLGEEKNLLTQQLYKVYSDTYHERRSKKDGHDKGKGDAGLSLKEGPAPHDGIGFKTFAIVAWNLCTCDHDGLVLFAFELFDHKGNGHLDLVDVEMLLEAVFGGGWLREKSARKWVRALTTLDAAGQPVAASVSLDRFQKTVGDSDIMLYPAFELQRKVQKAFLGVEFWEKMTKRRQAMMQRGEHSLKQLLAVINEGSPANRIYVPYNGRHFTRLKLTEDDGGLSPVFNYTIPGMGGAAAGGGAVAAGSSGSTGGGGGGGGTPYSGIDSSSPGGRRRASMELSGSIDQYYTGSPVRRGSKSWDQGALTAAASAVVGASSGGGDNGSRSRTSTGSGNSTPLRRGSVVQVPGSGSGNATYLVVTGGGMATQLKGGSFSGASFAAGVSMMNDPVVGTGVGKRASSSSSMTAGDGHLPRHGSRGNSFI